MRTAAITTTPKESWLSRIRAGLLGTPGEWYSRDGALLSAALAYYAAISLFPTCLVLIAALGFISRSSAAVNQRQQELLDTIATNTSPWLADQLRDVLAEIRTQADLGAPLGVVTLLFAAIGVFGQLESSFQRIFEPPVTPSQGILATLRLALYDRLLAFLLLLATGGIVLLVFLLNITLSALKSHFPTLSGNTPTWQALQTTLNLCLNTLLFTVLYKALPRVRVKWAAAWPGGVLLAIVWQVGQRVVERFVISDRYSAYGVVGSFLAIALWINYASCVLFLGAVFVRRLNANRPTAD